MENLKNILDYSLLGFLGFLSILSIGLAMERLLYLKRIDLKSYQTPKDLELDLTRGLHLIATIASNAPYIGLLGTVLGIMLTFYTIGQEGLVDTKKIMVGLALALKATAAGLIVAIPASALYNYILRKIKEKVTLWEVINGRKGI